MILALDIGNTRVKAACFSSSGEMLCDQAWGSLSVAAIEHWLPEPPKHVVASNSANVNPLPLSIASVAVSWLDFSGPWPFALNYGSGLGVDRLLAVLGALEQTTSKDVGVITCGTCLTFSALSSVDGFLGGIIAPGLAMRLTAMHQGTGSLPLLDASWEGLSLENPQTSQSEESMQRGAFIGMLQQITDEVTLWRKRYPTMAFLLNGGDGMTFANHLESGIFAASKLELIGLYAHWTYAQNSTSS